MNVVSTHFLSGYVTGRWDAVNNLEFLNLSTQLKDPDRQLCKNDVPNMVFSILFPDERKTLDDYKRISEMCNRLARKQRPLAFSCTITIIVLSLSR